MDITMSATVGGKKSSRVKVAERPAIDPNNRSRDKSPSRALLRFKKDPTTRGKDYTVIGMSIPVDELAALDAACAKAQMARSHFVRQAVKFFAAHVAGVAR